MLCSLNVGAPRALVLNGKGGFFNNVAIGIVHMSHLLYVP